MPSTRTRRKYQVGQALAACRVAAGRTTEQAAALIERTQSQVSKMENGYNLCVYTELTTLLNFYRVPEEQQTEIVALWREAKQDSRRIQGASAFFPKARAFLRAEADAKMARELQPHVVPGLAQTGNYAMAIHAAAQGIIDVTMSAEKVDVARLARQALLRGPNPLTFHALIDECVIRRIVGSRSVMVEQLEYLLTVGELDNVTFRVIPFEAGAYATSSGSFTVLSFDSPPDSVYLEYPGGGEWVDNREDIAKFTGKFDDVEGSQALTVVESVALIRERIEELRDDDNRKGMAQEH